MVLSKDTFPLLHSAHAPRLGLFVFHKVNLFWRQSVFSLASGLCGASLVQSVWHPSTSAQSLYSGTASLRHFLGALLLQAVNMYCLLHVPVIVC